jgi:hypothetical protein
MVTRLTRPHPGAQKGGEVNYFTLLQPHHEHNLYANPKQAAQLHYY